MSLPNQSECNLALTHFLSSCFTKKLGQQGQSSTTEMELQNYEYNIRGWLSGLNKGYSNNTGAGAWFGMELNYDFGFTANQYNGNMAGAQWCSKGDGERRACIPQLMNC